MYRQLKANGPWAYQDEDIAVRGGVAVGCERGRATHAKAAKKNAAGGESGRKTAA